MLYEKCICNSFETEMKGITGEKKGAEIQQIQSFAR